MKPQVLVSMLRDKEFFVVDEDITAEELYTAIKTMKNGEKILADLKEKMCGKFHIGSNSGIVFIG